ncbi:MAG: hypothetical protein LBC20_02265 [Planctomycetaceae bacterium]|jgi:hypothetical protein|nr:hypothetical protein [Planctomycetaceae bacterium]
MPKIFQKRMYLIVESGELRADSASSGVLPQRQSFRLRYYHYTLKFVFLRAEFLCLLFENSANSSANSVDFVKIY